MLNVVNASNALGISAPQLGESVQIIVINRSAVDPKKYGEPLVAINPLIKRHPYKPRRTMREGCLSIPGFFERVKRFEWIEWEYVDHKDGLSINSTVDGLLAAAVQHEIDHLNGILFIDHIDIEQRALFDANWKKIIAGITKEFEDAEQRFKR